MGVKLNFAAVNELPDPLEPGTIYYVDHGDGTATQVVTDAIGQITGRQVVGLMTSGALTRTGALQSGAVKTGTTFFQKFTPTRDIRLTQVTIQGLSVLSGTARIRISPNNGSGTTELAGADATPVAGGVTAPVDYLMTAGTPYIIGAYGASLSLTLSGGHTWDGLTQPDTALITSTPTGGGWTQEAATGAQMAFLFDVGGVPIRRVEAGQGLTGDVTAGVLTLAYQEARESGRWEGRWWGGLANPDQLNESATPSRRSHAVYLDYENELVAGSRAAFNAVFTGLVTPRYNEAYTLHYASDDGIRVYLDGVLVLNHWVSGIVGNASVSLGPLGAGRTYAMRVEWFQILNSEANRLKLEWSSPSQERELIRPTAGASSAVTSVAGRTGAVTLTSADLADFVEAAQDAAASMISDSTDVDAVYADGSNTLALKVTGIQNKAVPAGGTGKQSIRLNSAGTAWEFYDPASGSEPGGSGTLPAPGTAGNVLTSVGDDWVSAPAPGTGGGYQLTRTTESASASGPLNLTTNPLADGRVNELISSTGFDPGLSYVGASQLLRHGPLAQGSIWAWAEHARMSAFTFEMTATMTADTYGQQHAGLFVQTVDGTAATGYRIANHGGVWSVNRYVDGASQGAVGGSVSGPTFPIGVQRRLRLTVIAGGTMTLFVDDAQVGQWTDAANWVSGRPGAFAFRSTVEYKDISASGIGEVTVNGLGAGQTLRAMNGSSGAPTLPLTTLTRVDACAQDGGVLASAWMSPGETWLLT